MMNKLFLLNCIINKGGKNVIRKRYTDNKENKNTRVIE